MEALTNKNSTNGASESTPIYESGNEPPLHSRALHIQWRDKICQGNGLSITTKS